MSEPRKTDWPAFARELLLASGEGPEAEAARDRMARKVNEDLGFEAIPVAIQRGGQQSPPRRPAPPEPNVPKPPSHGSL